MFGQEFRADEGSLDSVRLSISGSAGAIGQAWVEILSQQYDWGECSDGYAGGDLGGARLQRHPDGKPELLHQRDIRFRQQCLS